MKKVLSVFLIAVFVQLPISAQKGAFAETKQLQSPQNPRLGFMIHGGAGVIRRGDLTPEKEKTYRAKLEEALLAGYKKLQNGASSLDAVQTAINLLEDSPLFNAGKGAQTPKTEDKKPNIKNRKQIPKSRTPESVLNNASDKFGTVGAVALDKDGNLAAETSTGGTTYKKHGRVADAPVTGAGTFADNKTCAVSATGWDEYFIRLGAARDISALMESTAMPIQQAADKVIKGKLQNLGGDGGIIAIDKYGNMAVSFNSEGMYRAYIDSNGKPVVEIYKN